MRLIRNRGKRVWRWWGGGDVIYLSLHCRHQNSCFKMGSDESHINVSVGSDGQSQKTVSTNHNLFWKERRAEAVSNRGPSAYQPNALPLGRTGSPMTITIDWVLNSLSHSQTQTHLWTHTHTHVWAHTHIQCTQYQVPRVVCAYRNSGGSEGSIFATNLLKTMTVTSVPCEVEGMVWSQHTPAAPEHLNSLFYIWVEI